MLPRYILNKELHGLKRVKRSITHATHCVNVPIPNWWSPERYTGLSSTSLGQLFEPYASRTFHDSELHTRPSAPVDGFMDADISNGFIDPQTSHFLANRDAGFYGFPSGHNSLTTKPINRRRPIEVKFTGDRYISLSLNQLRIIEQLGGFILACRFGRHSIHAPLQLFMSVFMVVDGALYDVTADLNLPHLIACKDIIFPTFNRNMDIL
jgi:hypothetical protein